MGRAPSVGQVFFPLDEELALLPGKLAPRQYEHLVHLSCFMSFEKAVQMMEEMVAVQTNEETARRLTEQVGSWMEACQTAEVEADSEPASEDEEPVPQCVISPDGAMISLVHKQWVETRTVAIGLPQEKRGAQGEREIHVGKLSYFSRLADVGTFTRLAGVEIRRRQVAQAKAVCAVMDGADWCQMFVHRYRPDALLILDFAHAAEHLAALLEALECAHLSLPPHMLTRCLHILKHRGPRSLLRMAQQLESHLATRKGVHEHVEYLRKREALMQYRLFRQQGWPIGSGMVESANKNVVEARLKGPGMHWQRHHVNPLLALRNAVCNDRWREMWHKALRQHRRLQALQKSIQASHRAQASLAGGHSSHQQSCPPSPAASKPISPPAQATSANLAVEKPACGTTGSSSSSTHGERGVAREKGSPSRSAEEKGHVCICGNPLADGGQRRLYCCKRCSNRARKRAQREREKHPRSSHPSTSSPRMEGTDRKSVPSGQPVSCAQTGTVSVGTCMCGTPLLAQPAGGQTRRYCSHRCRQRAYRQRQAQIS
jgi:hypothetical protein